MKLPFGVDRKTLREAFRMAWPSVLESFFVAFAGIVDSYMVSSLGAYAVAAVGLTTQPKFLALALFIVVQQDASIPKLPSAQGITKEISFVIRQLLTFLQTQKRR